MRESRKKNRPVQGHGPGRGMGPGEKPKNFTGTMKKLVFYMKPYVPQIIIILIFAIAGTVCSIVAPKESWQSTQTKAALISMPSDLSC